MASNSDPERHDYFHDYFPERSENIFNPQFVSNNENEVEQSSIPSTADSSTEFEGSLQPIRTNETAREEQFEPIRAGDREQLQRIASGFGDSQLGRTFTNRTSGTHDLEKRDSLYGVKLGDSTLDPNSPDFDIYKWTKM